MINKRKHDRFTFRRKVFTQANILIGYIENISLSGIKVSSIEPIHGNEEFSIWFGISNKSENEKKISLIAYRVWSSFTDTEPRMYYSGLHFVNPSEEGLDNIQELIRELST